MRSSKTFNLLWKSKFAPNQKTVDFVLRKMDEEINYLSTSVLPKSSWRQQKSVLKEIETLSAQRKELERKSRKWKKNYDEERNPRPYREIDTYTKSLTHDQFDDVVNYAKYLKRQGLSFDRISKKLDSEFDIYPDEIKEVISCISKSVSTKKQLFKQLYQDTWGTSVGLNEDEVNKMSERDLDEAIRSLSKIYQ